MEPYNDSELIAPIEDTKPLTYSSLLLLIPSWYAYMNNNVAMTVVSGLTSLISYTFWRNPLKKGLRRTLDLTFSKISFAIFVYQGINHVPYPECFMGYYIASYMMYNFIQSHLMYTLKNKHWVNFHVMFHLCVMTDQLFILYFLK